MQSTPHARAFFLSLLFVIPACRGDTSGPVQPGVLVTSAVQQQDDPYGSCPYVPAELAAATCSIYHPGSTLMAYCAFGTCFDMTRGGEFRIVAADQRGPFPQEWFAWHEGVLGPPPPGLIPCVLTRQRNKTRVEIPAPYAKCAVALTTTEHRYYEHIFSDSAIGCVGWVECRQY